MANLTMMTLETMLKTASEETLNAWVRDVENTCGVDGITATEARWVVGAEIQSRREHKQRQIEDDAARAEQEAFYAAEADDDAERGPLIWGQSVGSPYA